MKRPLLVALSAALVAALVGIGLLRREEPRPTAFIYLLDARPDLSKPLDQAPLVIRQLERRYGAKVTVRAATSLQQFRDYPAMFEEFDRTRNAIDPPPIFFELNRPYTDTKKMLRSAIDDSVLVQGASRVQLLNRLVVIRDTERLSERGECAQLQDDVAYVTDNFSAIGLLVHDGTIQELKKCIEIVIASQAGR